MFEEKIVISRGFDLFFNEASEAVLRLIADELGEGSFYDIETQSVTYMFRKNCRCEFGSLKQIHFLLKQQGLKLAEKFDCIYEASELYLTVSPTIADWLTANGGDTTKPILI